MLKKTWDLFFEEEQAEIAALLRIWFGLLCLLNLWDFYPLLGLLFGSDGLYGYPDPGYFDLGLPWFALFHLRDPWALEVWYWAAVAAGVCTVIGYKSRLATALSFTSYVLMMFRCRPMTYGADTSLLAYSFWLLFLDVGRAWSLDSRFAAGGKGKGVVKISAWPIKAIQMQTALIYLVAALLKLASPDWREGMAVYYAVSSVNLNSALAASFIGSPFLVKSATYGTLIIELSFPFLVFCRRFRWPALIMASLLHLGIEVLMPIQLFTPVMGLGLMSFIRPGEIFKFYGVFMRKRGVAYDER